MFAPSEIAVQTGESVRFEIENVGSLPHEFVLGDEASHEEHGDSGAGADGAISLQPGGMGSFVWTFTDAGTVLLACHIAGHFEAGMVGAIDVE